MKKYSIITDLSSDIQKNYRFENSVLFVTLGKLHFYLIGGKKNAFNYSGCVVSCHGFSF